MTETQTMEDWSDGWVIRDRSGEPATPFRRYLSLREARERALQTMADAEAARARYAEEEAARGLNW